MEKLKTKWVNLDWGKIGKFALIYALIFALLTWDDGDRQGTITLTIFATVFTGIILFLFSNMFEKHNPQK